MYPPLFSVCSANAGVQAIFGTSPCRIYPFGEAPEDAVRPYATWRVGGGAPENALDCAPDIDRLSIVVEVFAETGAGSRSGLAAIRSAIEGSCHIIAWGGEGRDTDTRLYNSALLADWYTNR